MKITQYGLGEHHPDGGWDGDSDPGTDAYKGNENNVIINGVSCALSPSARKKIGSNGTWLEVEFDNGLIYRRQVADATSSKLTDDRVDFFNAFAFDKQMNKAGQFAKVRILNEKPASTVAWWNPFK